MNRLVKTISTTIAAAIIWSAPGFGAHQAFAAVAVSGAARSVSVVPVGAGAASMARIAPSSTLNLNLAAPALSALPATLPVVQQAVVTPAAAAASVSAVAGRASSVLSVPSDTAAGRAGMRAPSKAPNAAAASNAAAQAANSAAAPSNSLQSLIKDRKELSISASDAGKMSGAQAHGAGAAVMDRILGLKASNRSSDAVAVPSGRAMARVQGLQPALAHSGEDFAPQGVESFSTGGLAPQSKGSKIVATVKSLVTIAAGAGAAYGLHAAAVIFLPSLFGALPVAAVWAVASGIFALPIGLYSRYRLALRDSSRLKGVKTLFDLSLGVLLGAAAVAAPVFFSGAAAFDALALSIPAIAAASYAMSSANRSDGAAGSWINAIFMWVSLNLLSPFMATVAATPIVLGGVFGLMAIPALITISFFLGGIVRSAETGRPFAVPGSLQQIRFPSYTWVMSGVVFALLLGYTPVWTNVAFMAWMMFSNIKVGNILRSYKGRFAAVRVFDLLFLGALGWAVATGFAAPITFLALAFLPERASMWTEDLLGRLLPAGKPAPSTKAAPMEYQAVKPARWPKFHYWLKTALAIGSLAGFGFILAATVFGWGSFLTNLGVAAALSVLPLLISKWLIKKTMRAVPLEEAVDPVTYETVRGIMAELRDLINAERRAKNQKEIPMPELVFVPMPVPNAFATGFSPMSAMVGVTGEMLDMTVNPGSTREGLTRLLSSVEPGSKSFAVFRDAVRISIPSVSESARPMEVIQALHDAPDAKVREIGVRALRGVMGHEFSHVMHRDMLLGSISGTLASGISFAAYGVLWAVGHAEAFLRDIFAGFTGGKKRAAKARPALRDGGFTPQSAGGEFKPEIAEPVTAAGGVVALLKLVGIFAALWAPVLARVLAMASSRTREGHADEAGGLLTTDPSSLAVGLGLLTAWRPKPEFFLSRPMLPRLASQAHIMTVNPIQQLHEAGLLGGKDAAGVPVSHADNWFLELFITHPDTTQRIERLHDMSQAVKAGIHLH